MPLHGIWIDVDGIQYVLSPQDLLYLQSKVCSEKWKPIYDLLPNAFKSQRNNTQEG